MAAPSVRIIKSWTAAAQYRKVQRVRQVELYSGTGGDGTDSITAASLKLNVIEEATAARYGDKAYIAAPNSDGTKLYLWDPSSPTAPTAVALPATPNGLFCVVRGY